MQMKEELKQQAEAANFKARPSAIVHKDPFVPKKENRPAFGKCPVTCISCLSNVTFACSFAFALVACRK